MSVYNCKYLKKPKPDQTHSFILLLFFNFVEENYWYLKMLNQKWKFCHYVFTRRSVERRVKFHSPQKHLWSFRAKQHSPKVDGDLLKNWKTNKKTNPNKAPYSSSGNIQFSWAAKIHLKMFIIYTLFKFKVFIVAAKLQVLASCRLKRVHELDRLLRVYIMSFQINLGLQRLG